MTLDDAAEIRSVAVVGLGLIGGSLARDLSARGFRVAGWDQDVGAFQAAYAAGVVHQLLGPESEPVDALVIAVPVLAAPHMLRKALQYAAGARLITDAGSTKRSIVHAAEALGIGARFVGAHPLAGDHRSGWDASRRGLFDGARVFLTPTASTRPDVMRLASDLWTAVGARPEVVDAAEHDARLAWTSHLPQLVSSALSAALAGRGIARDELGPGGRDVTRLAGSDPAMWADILIDNAEAMDAALATLSARIGGFRAAIAAGDRDAIHRLLAEARAWSAPAPPPPAAD
jgi:cyclohexadieny/prephenate dehydrogenase